MEININRYTLNILVYIYFFSNPILSFCQRTNSFSNDYKLDTIHYVSDLNAVKRVSSVIKMNLTENTINLLYKQNNNLILETIDLTSQIRKKRKLKNKLLNKININANSTFTFLKDTLIVASEDKLIGYILSKKSIIFQKPIKSIEYSKLINGVVLYGRYYNHNPITGIAPTCLYRYNVCTKKTDSVVLKTDFLEYSFYLPANFLTFNDKFTAYPLFGSYKLYLLNHNLETIDSIQRELNDWISPSIELHNSISKNPMDLNLYFPLLDKESFEHIHRIEFIEWLDTNQLLVRWYKYDTLLKHRVRYIDIWTKELKSTFKLTSTKIETHYPLMIDSSLFEYGFPIMSENYYTQYKSNYIVQIKSELELNPNEFKTYREYLVKRKEYGIKKEPIISIWVFKYKG